MILLKLGCEWRNNKSKDFEMLAWFFVSSAKRILDDGKNEISWYYLLDIMLKK